METRHMTAGGVVAGIRTIVKYNDKMLEISEKVFMEDEDDLMQEVFMDFADFGDMGREMIEYLEENFDPEEKVHEKDEHGITARSLGFVYRIRKINDMLHETHKKLAKMGTGESGISPILLKNFLNVAAIKN